MVVAMAAMAVLTLEAADRKRASDSRPPNALEAARVEERGVEREEATAVALAAAMAAVMAGSAREEGGVVGLAPWVAPWVSPDS